MKNIVALALTISSIFILTLAVVLYGDGWRIDFSGKTQTNTKPELVKTGMLAIRSIPDGAKVYVNEKLITATDDTISSLRPSTYTIEVKKEGFEPWKKEVKVFPELVTDITAVLVLQSPRLEPLTNTDVKAFSLSSNQNDIAFLTSNHEEPGIWILPLANSPLGVFRNNTRLLIEDTAFATPSIGEQIWWSPNDKEILIKMNEKGYLLYTLPAQNTTKLVPLSVTNVQSTLARWETSWRENFLQPKIELISKSQQISKDTMNALENQDTFWSPDEDKFFYLSNNSEDSSKYDITVYNAEDPLPVAEQRVYHPLQIDDPEKTKVYWYSDSYHLITVDPVPGRDKYYTVSLIRIDGSNQTPIYTGTLESDQAYTTPSGDKIVVITSLKDNSKPNLYAIVIR
ncbi:hypothetical protein A2982_00080 [candidate division WWE3 bacterium RIFCSPLOWO2_01_FULL_39_13]|uniref:PEGA domain-containing protein n=1 Tax=candidate division WWE3 bacterium RIFCSPLOWO2_01_FULL_39_13 TaxID=1802624 RepID=A0A1F4V484_UNCKA|nr:MAG: hypothetical protein A2982_00080 [candidate division WWE3 bacterium RIFCSPLOWO2_01_FULL_39_13]